MPALIPTPLNQTSFAAYGQVIEVPRKAGIKINDGTAVRHDALANVDTAEQSGEPVISIFVAQARPLPITLQELEQHPLGSQAFMPLDNEAYLVVVAEQQANGEPGKLHAFLASAAQGINLHRGVWHHPLLALKKTCRFLVVDRHGPGENLVVVPITTANYLVNLQSM